MQPASDNSFRFYGEEVVLGEDTGELAETAGVVEEAEDVVDAVAEAGSFFSSVFVASPAPDGGLSLSE
jgi:hypothetical protein